MQQTTDIVTCAGFVWLVGSLEDVEADTAAAMAIFSVETVASAQVATRTGGSTAGSSTACRWQHVRWYRGGQRSSGKAEGSNCRESVT